MDKPVTAALPGDNPKEYDSAEQAVLHMQSDLIAQGKDPHITVTVAIPLGGSKVALIQIPLDQAHRLDAIIKRGQKGYE